VRAFVAIEIPPAVRREAFGAARALTQLAPGFRVPAEENLHLTLAFLGEVEEARLFLVTRELAGALSKWKPFPIALRGAGRFPPRGRPRVAWIGVSEGRSDGESEGANACVRLARDVGEACARAGAPSDEKPFRPHLTVGRARERAGPGELVGLERWIQERADMAVGAPFPVERVVLFESRLTPTGSLYTERGAAPLGG
jgi:RNA 2',3'-cyclic 3'-phosphodiesterase